MLSSEDVDALKLAADTLEEHADDSDYPQRMRDEAAAIDGLLDR